MNRTILCAILALSTSSAWADGYSSTEAPSYNVVKTTSAPVIDGVVSPGEWGRATPAADRFVNLRADTPDTHNIRFQAMWDDDNLYLLGLSDYDNFASSAFATAPNNPAWGGNGYQYNFYVDPNTDGERTWTEPVPNDAVDGYQIAWDVYQGFGSRRPTPERPQQSLRDPLDANGTPVNDYGGGFYLEAHVNTPWGDQGLWVQGNQSPNTNYRDDAFPGLVYAANADNTNVNGTGRPGHVWEWSISWESFNATNPNRIVSQEEASLRPEYVVDTRETIFTDELGEIPNPDFNQEVLNVGQIPGFAAFIGNAGETDLRFADPDSAVFLDNGLYAVEGPEVGDTWAFEMAVITNDQVSNFLPTWSEPAGGDPTRGPTFAPWGTVGHGRLVFSPVPEPSGNLIAIVGLLTLLICQRQRKICLG